MRPEFPTVAEPLGPFCQSCSMPLGKPEDFGAEAAGYRVNDYCRFCYQDGKFTEPDVTLAEITDRGVKIMASRGLMPEAEARALLSNVLPRLKRWATRRPSAPAGRGFTGGDEIC